MTIDVIDLRDFYSQRLGIVARRLINRGIHARWPSAGGQRVLGIGYPTPYLGLLRDSERCIAFMPAAQGVLKWPTARPWFLRSAMAWERVGAALSLPFAGVHIVEATKQVYRAIQAHRERTRLVRRCRRSWCRSVSSARRWADAAALNSKCEIAVLGFLPSLQGRVRRGVALLVPRIEVVARAYRRGHAVGAGTAMRPAAAAARRETFAAIAFEATLGAVDLRLRSGDERGQAIDGAVVGDHRLRLRLWRLKLRLRTMLAIRRCARGAGAGRAADRAGLRADDRDADCCCCCRAVRTAAAAAGRSRAACPKFEKFSARRHRPRGHFGFGPGCGWFCGIAPGAAAIRRK